MWQSAQSRRRWSKRLPKIAAALVLLVVLLRWFERSQVYQPSRTLDANPAELGRQFEDVFFKTSDGVRLNGWFFPADANSSRAQIAVLYCHGNGGNISHRMEVYRTFLKMGLNVFAFDYRGYGRSEGRTSEEGTYRDAQAAYRWLRDKGFEGRNIIAFGESLGGGIVSELALREEVGGLVLQSAFSCTADIGAELFPWLPVHKLCTIKYETCQKLPRIRVPVLVMHSRGDELINFRHAQKNSRLANEPKLLWEIEGEHNDPLGNPAKFVEGMEQLLQMMQRVAPQKSSVSSEVKTSIGA
jgi:pimeloyl-ACP methyl ester carboxylesterase